MENSLILKKDIIEKITADGALFGKISVALDVAPVSLPRILYKNDQRLTQATVLRIIKEHLEIESDSELLVEQY
jgi:hypothetical protein